MLKVDTYLVCNSGIVSKFRSIDKFTLNLGQSLVNNQNQFMPADVKIQKHFLYFKEIVNLIGYIGTLSIYTTNNIGRDEIMLCNNNEQFRYKLDNNLSMYDNVNTSISLFFDKIGLNQDVVTEFEEPEQTLEEKATNTKKEEYLIPTKPMSEMSELERIEYARNLK